MRLQRERIAFGAMRGRARGDAPGEREVVEQAAAGRAAQGARQRTAQLLLVGALQQRAQRPLQRAAPGDVVELQASASVA